VFLASPVGFASSVSQDSLLCQSGPSDDHRPNPASWCGRLILSLCVMLRRSGGARSIPSATSCHSVLMEMCPLGFDDVAPRPFTRMGRWNSILYYGNRRDCNLFGGSGWAVRQIDFDVPALILSTGFRGHQCARSVWSPTPSARNSDICTAKCGWCLSPGLWTDLDPRSFPTGLPVGTTSLGTLAEVTWTVVHPGHCFGPIRILAGSGPAGTPGSGPVTMSNLEVE
jgi:hypothetical protein